MTAEGRALSKPRGDGFAALSWLENDGDGARQAEAAARGVEDLAPPALAGRAALPPARRARRRVPGFSRKFGHLRVFP